MLRERERKKNTHQNLPPKMHALIFTTKIHLPATRWLYVIKPRRTRSEADLRIYDG